MLQSKKNTKPFKISGFSGQKNKFEQLRKKLIKKTRQEITEEFSGKEIHSINAINAIEDLDNAFNLLAEHAIDWHSFNFPELKRTIKDNSEYLLLISQLGGRKNFFPQNVQKIILDTEKNNQICMLAQNSVGVDFDQSQENAIKSLAVTTLSLKNQKNALEKFLKESMKTQMPNTSIVLGENLAAKILARAGSLKKLALMPSSRLQVLGAEKALYSHIKNGSMPPKHGILFQHPLISTQEKKKRGKNARTIAAKTTIAARLDYFGQNKQKLGEQLKKEIEKKTSEKK